MQSQRLLSLYSTQSQTDERFLARLSVLDGKEEEAGCDQHTAGRVIMSRWIVVVVLTIRSLKH